MIERIRTLLALRQLSPTQFADLIQVGRPIVSHILSGRNKASLEVVQRIMAAFPEIALPWLLSGTGSMLNGAEPVVAATSTNAPALPKPATQRRTMKSEPLIAAPPAVTLSAQQNDFELASSGEVADANPASLRAASDQATDLRVAQPSKLSSQRVPPRFRPGGGQQIAQAAEALRNTKELTEPPVIGPSGPTDSSSSASKEGSNGLDDSPLINQRSVAVISIASPANTENEPRAQLEAAPLSTGIFSGDVPGTDTAKLPASLLPAPKRIRRIVIFYQDGSFADFQPES